MPGDYANISGYFWVPIVGPLIGGGLASVFYDVFIHDILGHEAAGARGITRRRDRVRTGPGASSS